MNRRRSFELEVPGHLLSTLILAVHNAAERAGSDYRWRYGNVVGIGQPQIGELEVRSARARHSIDTPLLAGITVVAQRHVAVDVLFAVDRAGASARFVGAGADDGEAAERELSWAQCLAAATNAQLVAEGVSVSLRERDVAVPTGRRRTRSRPATPGR